MRAEDGAVVTVSLADLLLLLQKAEPLLCRDWEASNAIDRLGDTVLKARMERA